MDKDAVTFNRFSPRPYQLKLCEAFESSKYKKYLIVWPRRARQGYMCTQSITSCSLT